MPEAEKRSLLMESKMLEFGGTPECPQVASSPNRFRHKRIRKVFVQVFGARHYGPDLDLGEDIIAC